MLSLIALFVLQGAAEPRLVTVETLAKRLDDPRLVMLHVGDDRSKPVYDAGHIPGSQFVHPWRDLAAPRVEGALALELPSAAQLDSVLESKGISNDSWVVLIPASEYFSPASRVALTLEYAGLGGRVSFLDGGLEAWKKAGKAVTADVPTPKRGQFTPGLHPEVVVNADYVKSNLENAKVTLIDARDTSFYNGADAHQARSGHIPGAKSMPFTSMIAEDGRFKDLSTLGRMFRQAGAEPGGRVITYCHIGQQATLVWFAAKLLGYDASLYDGSFQDWSARRELPVVGPTAKPE